MKIDEYLKQDHPDTWGLPTQQALEDALNRAKAKKEPVKTITIKSGKKPAPRHSSNKSGRRGHAKAKGIGQRWRFSNGKFV